MQGLPRLGDKVEQSLFRGPWKTKILIVSLHSPWQQAVIGFHHDLSWKETKGEWQSCAAFNAKAALSAYLPNPAPQKKVVQAKLDKRDSLTRQKALRDRKHLKRKSYRRSWISGIALRGRKPIGGRLSVRPDSFRRRNVQRLAGLSYKRKLYA
jgi:hypothetical protein